VLLSGVGGDELFGGYPWQAGMRALPSGYLSAAMRAPPSRSASYVQELWSRLGSGRLRARIARAYRLLAQFRVWHAQSLCSAFVPYMRDMDRKIAERIESVSETYFQLAVKTVAGDPYNQVHYANIFTVIGNQNYQLDMASMRHSVENRSPMLDFNIVEYLMSVPDRLKNRNGPKSLMRGMLAEFLPAYITGASKSGPTMPLDQWYADECLGSSARSFLLGNRELISELVSTDLASRLHDPRLYAGRVGAIRAFALLSLVIWAKINVLGSIPEGAVSFSELAAANV
jgi:asparagine synthase (glutamine-hydrolysing)